MHALGSPLHAFDWDLIRGGIVVRRAGDGERVTTLDGVERRLDERDLVIADHERAVALAAIMGGAETEISEGTTNVLLEAANFEPVGVLRTSERLGLADGGLEPLGEGSRPAPRAACGSARDGAPRGAGRGALGGRPGRARRAAGAGDGSSFGPSGRASCSGSTSPPRSSSGSSRRLGFEVDGSAVTVPSWRARDVTREVDLVEEVGRFKLDDVPFTLPERRELFGRLDAFGQLRRSVEDVLVGCGLTEAYTPSLVADDPDPGALRLSLPMTSEQSVLRTMLLPSLLEAATRNREVGNEDVALFEIARVYLPAGEGELPDERWRVGGVVEGDYADAKGVVDALLAALKIDAGLGRGSHELLHPGKTAELGAVTGEGEARRPGGLRSLGVVGEVHPAVGAGWAAFELDLAGLLDAVPGERALRGRLELSRRCARTWRSSSARTCRPPSSRRRCARRPARSSARCVSSTSTEAASSERSKRSLAFRVAFQSRERTLSDEDAQALRTRIVEALAARYGAVLRA